MQIAKFLPLALLAAGCATEEVVQPEEAVQPYLPQVNTLSTAAPQAAVAQVAYKQFILDGIAPTMVNVQEIRRSRTNDGYERVQVLVKNFTTSPMPVATTSSRLNGRVPATSTVSDRSASPVTSMKNGLAKVIPPVAR